MSSILLVACGAVLGRPAGFTGAHVSASLPDRVLPCPRGSVPVFTSRSSHLCKPCAAGYYAAAGICFACGVGRYQPNPKQSTNKTCIKCPSGYSTNRRQAVDICAKCIAGKFSDEDASAECKVCPAGYSSPGSITTNGSMSIKNLSWISTYCAACSKGSHGVLLFDNQERVLQSACACCPRGYFQASVGQLSCAVCTIGSSSPPGSSTCRCQVGYSAAWYNHSTWGQQACAA